MKDKKLIFRLRTRNRRALEVLAEYWEVNRGEAINLLIEENYRLLTKEPANHDFAL